MSDEMLRKENGVEKRVATREAMAEINHAMMGGSSDVSEMFGAGQTWYIRYVGGRAVFFTPAPPEPVAEPEENVVSYNGGKVHSAMPGLGGEAYPLCRGGGMNQLVTKFRFVKAPLSCKTCLTYAERRASRGNA